MTRLPIALIFLYSLVLFACSNGGGAGTRPGGGGLGSNTGGQGSGNTGSQGFANSSSGGSDGIVLPGTLCGNGQRDEGEECDDTNKTTGDGCDDKCRRESGDWNCPIVGPCIEGAVCGDGIVSRSEECDDSNTADGDGCSANCLTVTPGYQCRVPGQSCVPLCGDGQIVGTENCDDSNVAAGDGCSPTCLTEPGWSCTPGATPHCKQSICGNGEKEAGETCDAGPNNGLFLGDGTGCSKTCTQEPKCRDAQGVTAACQTPCGDGNIDPGEDCDDGNQVAGDGCGSDCKIEAGFTCGQSERKDTVNCTNGAGQCLVLPITYRDFDHQQLATGHPDFFFYKAGVTGCVPNASGANLLNPPANGTCPPNDATNPCKGIAAAALGPNGKPTLGTTTTCTCTFTDWDKTGILTGGTPAPRNCQSGDSGDIAYIQNVTVPVVKDAASFAQWYTDSALSTKVVSTLELAQVGATNQYQFSSSNGRTVYDDIHDIWLAANNRPAVSAPPATTLESGFFPLDTQTGPGSTKLCNLWNYWNPPADCVANDNKSVWQQWDALAENDDGSYGQAIRPVTGVRRNFYFTSEVRYLFRFVGGETLSFFGDDDVFVFINGKLVLDLGAPHERMSGTVTLPAGGASATWTASVVNLVTNMATQLPAPYGTGNVAFAPALEVGKTYEIAIFHADRHPRESNYQLTLSGFATNITSCQPTCGDGVKTGAEECDLGAMNQDGAYGGCTTQCKFGPFCGDGTVDAVGGEQCDAGRENGINSDYNGMGCRRSCQVPPRCGDGVVDGPDGEQCDNGPANSDSPNAECSTKCLRKLT